MWIYTYFNIHYYNSSRKWDWENGVLHWPSCSLGSAVMWFKWTVLNPDAVFKLLAQFHTCSVMSFHMWAVCEAVKPQLHLTCSCSPSLSNLLKLYIHFCTYNAFLFIYRKSWVFLEEAVCKYPDLCFIYVICFKLSGLISWLIGKWCNKPPVVTPPMII